MLSLCRQQQAEHIEIKLPTPRLRSHRLQWAKGIDARIVNENINLRERIGGFSLLKAHMVMPDLSTRSDLFVCHPISKAVMSKVLHAARSAFLDTALLSQGEQASI